MGEVGRFLREAREAKGVPLEDIARSTRVSRSYLEALELERWADLPAPVFVKGFIRSYCQALGIPADPPLDHYRLGPGQTGSRGAQGRAPAGRPAASRGGDRSTLVTSLVLLAVLAVALAGVTLARRPPAVPVSSAASPPPPPAAEAPPGRAPSLPVPDRAPAQRSASAPSAGQRLSLTAVEPTWVRIRMDTGRPVEELLPAGARREWTTPVRFVLTVGNAGGIRLELNGQPLPPLGASGVVVRDVVLPRPPTVPAS
jgi:cytoskeletal protein RodZ